MTITDDDYSAAGGGTGDFPSGTTYDMRFNVGSQNNLYLTGFEIGEEVYNFVLLAEIINIERVDNATTTGRHHIVLYEQSSVSGTDVDLKPSYAHTMEEALRSPIVNRGADNVFANTGDDNANNNNIQRIDYIFPDGFPVFNNIDQRGFLIMDRGGNDRFKIAAITALDANGNPSEFTDPVTVLETDWGDSGITLDTVVMRGYTEDGGVQHPSANVAPQSLAGVFVTWQTLGLETNDFIYGYSLAANDVTDDGALWTEVDNPAYFPTDTSPAADFGGLDLISGGMMFFEADLDVTIGDFVWNDWNGDGIQDPGEPGLSNVLVHVYDAHTNLAAVARTDSNGLWLAQGIGPGDFFVEFFLPTGYQFTVQYAGTDTAVDSNADPVTGRSEVFTIGSGQVNRTIDAGMHLAPGDLRLEKSVAPDAVKRGDEVVYTVVVTNVGPEIVNLVQVTDPLPTAVAFEGYGASQGTYDDGAGLWDIGTLGLGASATLTVTGTVHSGFGCSIITNTAEITRMDRPDTNTADNVDSATFYIECADLAVIKTVDDDNPVEGQAIEFTITLNNLGPDDVEDIELTDLLPAGLTFSNAVPSQGSYNDGTGIWSVGAVTNNGSAMLVLTAVPDPGTGGTTLTNTATITASSHDDPDPDNNEDSAVILVQGADLAVTKTVDKPAASEGDTVIYTITVENLGPSDTTGVEVTDPLVAGVTYTDDTPSQGSYNSGTGVWSVGALGAGSNATLLIEAMVDGGTMGQVLTNTAAVTASDIPDPNPANDEDSATVFVSGMAITKTSDVSGAALPGDTITYTIVITNGGATAQTDVTVVDPVPTGVTFVPDTVSVIINPPVGAGGTFTNVYDSSSDFVVPDGVTNVIVEAWGAGGGAGKATTDGQNAGGGGGGGGYARGSVAVTPGATNTVTVGTGGATATAGGDSWFGTTTTVFAQGGAAGGDPAGGTGGSANIGNQATFNGGGGGAGRDGGQPATRRGGGGGGSATASGNGGAGEAGGNNAGGAGGTGEGSGGNGTQGAVNGNPGNAPGGGGGGGGNDGVGGAGADGRVIVIYTEPAGMGITNNPPNLASGWTLEPGSTMTLTFEVTVNNPATVTQVVNTASVTSAEEPTPLSDTVIDPLANTDLAVFKSVSDDNPAENDTITYTVVVTNLGPADATGVVIEDVLPAGVTYVSDTPGQGSYNNGTGLWTVGTVNFGASAQLILTVTVDPDTAGSTITNTARLSASDVADSNPDNNEDSAVITVFGVDIGVGKAFVPSTVYEREQVIFTITATNFGPNAATGVEVTDVLPAGLTYVSHSASQGAYNAGSGAWSIGALAVSQSESLTITATVQTNTAGSSITNTATVTGVNQIDYNPANDTASVTLNPEIAPLDIVKNVAPAGAVSTGSTLTYTITVTNSSGQAMTGVAVTDTLPPGVTYVAASTEVSAPVDTNKTFRDEFNLRSYSRNNGTENWTGNWIEGGEDDGPTAGNIQVLFDTVRGATYSLRMAGPNRSLAREADLSPYLSATLSFDYRRQGLAAGEYFAVEVSSNGLAGTWTELDRFEGPATDSEYAFTNYNISAWIATNTAIRFVNDVGTMDVTDIVWFDDVEIAIPLRPHVSSAGGSPPNLASGHTLLPGEYLTVTFDVTVDQPGIHTQLVNTASVISDQMTQPRTDTAVTPVNLAPITIGDRVWYDVNRNGIQDPGETNGIPDVPVYLVNTNDVIVASTSTDTNGLYRFEDILPGYYLVRFDVSGIPTNLMLSPALVGEDRTVDSNPECVDAFCQLAETAFYYFTEGETNLTIDAGLMQIEPTRAEIADVWGEWTGQGEVVWQTSSEVGTAGFVLYRVDPATDAETRLNGVLIPSSFRPEGDVYRHADPDAGKNETADYRLEEIELAGTVRDLGTHTVSFGEPKPGPVTVPVRSTRSMDTRMARTTASVPPSDCLKVRVREEGLYGVRVTDIADGMARSIDEIREWADSGQLAMSAMGQPVPYHFDAEGNRLLFFGRGTDNWYTRDAVYWITPGEGVALSRRDPGAASGTSVFPVERRFKEHRYPFFTRYPRPEEFYYWDFVLSGIPGLEERDLELDLSGHAGGPVRVRVQLFGWSETFMNPDHLAEFEWNGVPVGSITFDNREHAVAEFDVPSGIAADGINTLTVRGVLQEGHSHSYFVIDWVKIVHDRNLEPAADTILFRAVDAETVSAVDFQRALVWSVDDPAAPIWIAGEDGTLENAAWSAVPGERFALIEWDAVPLLTPEPGTCEAWFMDPDNRIDYLVITSRELKDAAEELAAYREEMGLRAGVAVFEEICDLLMHGLRTPEAIPALLRYAAEHWAESPWLVVLAGDGHYDYLGVYTDRINHLPPLLQSTPDGLFASDEQLTDLNDDGLPDIAIGRLPADTAAELTVMIDKIRAYEAESNSGNGSHWKDRLVLAADENDGAGDFVQASERFAARAAPRKNIDRIYLDQMSEGAARAQLRNAFNNGAGIVHYTGHGGLDNLSSQGLLRRGDVPNMNNARHPLVIATSCLISRFETPDEESLGEALIRRPGGGAVAVWGPSALSQHTAATALADAFYRTTLEDGSGTLGMAVLRARRAMQADRFTRDTLVTYNLLGDPAMKLGRDRGGHPEDHRFAQWRWERFTPGELADPDISGADADANGDGWNNYLTFAFGGNPGVGDSLYPPLESYEAEPGNQSVLIRWNQRRLAPGLEYRISTSTDLRSGSWQPHPPGLQILSRVPAPDDVMEQVTARLPFTGNQLYIRLDVIRK